MKFNIKYLFFTMAFSSVAVNAQLSLPADSVDKAKKEVNVLFGQQEYGRFVGNMSTIKGSDLETYPALMINEALAGKLPGVFIRQNQGTPGIDDFNIAVRGSLGGYIVLVDGVDRTLTQYDIEQIEEVTVLKDPVSKALYGGRMCNGIIMVTTKRGKNTGKEFRLNIQQGMKRPTRLPGYLNAYDFATKYNEALSNDGIMTGRYDDAALEGYKNGNRPYQYPDVDYYDEFLNNFMNVTRVNAEYYGGNEKTRYYVHGAYQNEGGLEKYGDKKTKMNAFNLQGNLDTQFSKAILLHANFAGYIGDRVNPGGFSFSTLSSRYPNAYPIFVGKDSVGGTSSWLDNPYAAQALTGYYRESQIRVQGDMALTFKLDRFVKGLSVKPVYSFDVYHMQKLSKIHRPAIYSIASFDENGNPLTFNEIQTSQPATEQSFAGDDYLNRWTFMTTVSYDRIFNKNHAFKADLVYYISKASTAGDQYDYKRLNLGLRANYTFRERYTVEGVINYVGSQSYAPDHRFKFYPAIGAGWLVSNESFMRNIDAVDFFKVNASWGIMGDGNISPNLWRRSWGSGGRYYFNSSSYGATSQLTQVENYALNWPKQQEIDISLEMNFLKSIYAKFSYFDYKQTGLLSKKVNTIPSIIGGTLFLPYDNFEENGMKGMEAELAYGHKIKDFSFRIGAHATYSKTNKIVVDELNDPNYTTVGTPTDAIWGYRSNGYYTQAEIDEIQAGTSNLPMLADLNPLTLKAGNIKYQDLNHDGVIDKYDTEVIGNSAPRLMYGFDFNFGYKGFNLYVMFLGYGKHDCLLNNAYYQIRSTRKYSNVLNDGLPNGNPHPLLTTGEGTNDFQTSDYWIANGRYLKLQNVALSYSLPKKAIDKMRMKEMKFTLYGTDLLTFSKIEGLDPESFNAGLTQFPLFSTYALGVSVTF